MRRDSKFNKLISGSKELKASTAYMICSVLQRALSLITLPLFTRMLSTEQYGLSTVYSSTMAVIIIFVTLNLPYGSFSPAMMKFEDDREGYISAVNMICTVFTVGFFVVYLLARNFWNYLFDIPTVLMIIMGFEMLMTTSQQLWMGKARFEYRYKEFVIITLLTSVLATGCSLIAVINLPNKGIAKIAVHGLVVIAVGAVIYFNTILKGRQCFNKTYWRYALSFNIPLVPYYLSQIVFNQSDRLMINKMLGRSDAALYGVAYQLAFVLTFVLNAINNAFVPWLYRKIKEERIHENKEVSVYIAVIMAVLLLGLIALAPEIILIMAGDKYSSAIWVVPPVAMSLLLLFYSQLFINIEFYFEEKYKLVGASILAAIVNIVLNYFGIKWYGFVAAGYTTLVSYILFATCNYLAMKKTCRENGITELIYNNKALVWLFLLFVIMGFVFASLYPYRTIRFVVIAMLFVLILAFRKTFLQALKKVKYN